jgi:hypothetical protein
MDFDEADQSALSIHAHGVNKLEGDTSLAFDLGLAYLDENNDSGYGISTGLSLESVDDFDVSTLGFTASYFVTPAIGLGLSYETLGQDGDGDTIELISAARFKVKGNESNFITFDSLCALIVLPIIKYTFLCSIG